MRLGARVAALLLLNASLLAAQTQINADVLGEHNMAPASGSPITGNLGSPCLYCHAPHSGINNPVGVSQTPLWSQTLSSVQSYQVYTSSTMVNQTNPSPPLGNNSTLCLSCHDGTVALGTTTPYGQVSMSATLSGTAADLGTNLQATHPFSFITPLQPASDIWASLTASPPTTQDTTGAVKLIGGNVECGSCHNPHVQNIDPSSDFLVINNSQSALCLACHSTIPSGSGMGLDAAHPISGAKSAEKRRNPLASWNGSVHATAENRVSAEVVASGGGLTSRRMSRARSLGPYTTMRKNGCLSCHASHNSEAKVLLRTSGDQACLSCHNGGTSVTPAAPDIAAEMTVPKIGHASLTTTENKTHEPEEAVLLNHNRHAACVDCHNPHATRQVSATFPVPPLIRASQSEVEGISATDGHTAVSPATYQYENCLRCHGTSAGKATPAVFGYQPMWLVTGADPLNLLLQFNATAISKHPVMRDRSSPFPQPSLRPNMLQLDGMRQGRTMGVRILCTDCHNSDDNREFGGTGPNGPHGSKYSHLLERRYDMSQAPVPGQLITNLNVPPNLTTTGNYALCAKCHDLTSVVANASFSEHARHINDGFSCSVCHTSHGVSGQLATVSGERLVNFDLNVVAPNGRTPITYHRATNSCTLTCHGHAHNGVAGPAGGPPRIIR